MDGHTEHFDKYLELQVPVKCSLRDYYLAGSLQRTSGAEPHGMFTRPRC